MSLAVAVVVLVVVAVGVDRWGGLGHGRAMVTATGRAVVQLAAVGLVIALIFRTPWLAPLYLVVVLATASHTSARRLRAAGPAFGVAVTAIGTATAVVGLVVFASRALAWEPRSAVPFLVQLIGGSMTATTLAGQRMIDDATAGWDQVEGWLALGARPRQAVAQPAARAAARAVVPVLDQTRNVGLVVLPGAYVGLLLGGADPLEAGRIQLLVLVGLLAAEAVAAVTVTRLLSARLGARRPGPVAG